MRWGEPRARDRLDKQRRWHVHVQRQTEYRLSLLGPTALGRAELLWQYDGPHPQPGPHGERYQQYTSPGDLVGHPGDWQENLPDYYGICASLDENIGRILSALDRLDLAEDTLGYYTSDHGSHFRTRNSEYKRSCHEACIRIPLIARGPGIEPGVVVDELVSLVDVPPTLLELGGIDVPSSYHGRSMMPLVRGESVDWPEDVFLQISESQVGRAVRTGKWKFCVDAPDKSGRDDPDSPVYVEQYLYDLESDPHEQHNLVGQPEHRAVADELIEILLRRMSEAGEGEPEIIRR